MEVVGGEKDRGCDADPCLEEDFKSRLSTSISKYSVSVLFVIHGAQGASQHEAGGNLSG